MKIRNIASSGFSRKEKKELNKRHLKYGSLATGLTVMFVAAVVLVNIVTTMLFERFPISLDLTGNSIYSVSEETKDYVSGLEVSIDITVMSTEDSYRGVSDYAVQCAELLKLYTQYNPRITVRYRDLLSNPDLVANYVNLTIAEGDIIVEPSGDHSRAKVITLADIINVPDDYVLSLEQGKKVYGGMYTHQVFDTQGLIASSNAEQALTSAIMAVSDANPITVCTLSYPGANESDVSGLTDLLDKNGYVITSLDIRSEEIPEDVDIIIIPAPKIDYTTAETEKISSWLTNGGELGRDLIYVASTELGSTPNIDALLYRYGITVEPKIIYETDTNYYSNLATYTFQSLASESYQDDIGNPSLSVYVPDSRAISSRFALTDGYNTCETLVSSSMGAVLRDMYDSSDDWTAQDATERGSFASVVLGRYKALNQETHISRFTNVIAVGSDRMLQSTLMSAPQFNNGDFFLSLINELSGKTEGVTIVPKRIKASGVLVNDSLKNSLNLAFAVIIPAVVLAAGCFVWIRRRHR